MLKKEDAKIKWQEMTAEQIKNLVRGLNPIMGAYTYLDDKKIKFWNVKNISEEEFNTKFEKDVRALSTGEAILSDAKIGLYIKSKEGIVKVIEIQGENSKKMNIEDYLRGNQIKEGKIFK